MKPTIEDMIRLFSESGSQMYGGEAVSQLEHALQCAALAEAAGETKELVIACLFHDLGHLIHDLAENAVESGLNDHHEYRAIPLLRQLFPPAVTEPIRLHVEAKRYLCAVKPGYWESLSPTSQRSLELQGGVFSHESAQNFICQPYAADAVQLRIYDDQAKVVDLSIPDLNHFAQIAISPQ